MLEYTLDDAENLLVKNHTAAVKSLGQVDTDLGFIRDQTTTIEVSILYASNDQFDLAVFDTLFCAASAGLNLSHLLFQCLITFVLLH